ncbi:MAG: EAL domain-containing protein [Rhizobiaceae bacterium]|nr:EAL domain-containing protein [Rhizobiaceae bacterium]
MAASVTKTVINDLLANEGPAEDDLSVVARALNVIRSHLGMDVAYVSEFVGNESVFREVDAPGLEALIKVGDRRSLDDIYCRHILEGRLPELIPDTGQIPLAASMPITSAVPIGSHVSIPIKLPDGRPYGMFCCLSARPDRSLGQRDLEIMRAFADFAADEIITEIETKKAFAAKRSQVVSVITGEGFSIHYQPIWNIRSGQVVGFESLSRFNLEPTSPDHWFQLASEVGMSLELELAAIKKALSGLGALEDRSVYLAINASPDTAGNKHFRSLLDGFDLTRIVLEITEHTDPSDIEHLIEAIEPLRKSGMRLAIDDVGVGHSGLQRMLKLRPDLLKLDMSLTRNIHADPARQALASALARFSSVTETTIIAEGVESRDELEALNSLGIEFAQGYLLGRPKLLKDAMDDAFGREPSLR